ncbi:unnamed protein product [Prorocentrum cordatum]|uniref:Secreted protein n=1 Tax=Prorocentrum cordatum TaxID=2364126 RepID=A0ABN9X9L5_9DINO|nr:unnamed protein product [Polarella glacialis]
MWALFAIVLLLGHGQREIQSSKVSATPGPPKAFNALTPTVPNKFDTVRAMVRASHSGDEDKVANDSFIACEEKTVASTPTIISTCPPKKVRQKHARQAPSKWSKICTDMNIYCVPTTHAAQ